MVTISTMGSLMLLATAHQTAWKPFPVSASSDFRVMCNDFPEERTSEGVVEPQNVPSSADLDYKE